MRLYDRPARDPVLNQMAWSMVKRSGIYVPDVDITEDELAMDYFLGTVIMLDLLDIDKEWK